MAQVLITINDHGITVDQDPVEIPQGAVDEPIDWTIATPGWNFTDNGIVIHWNFFQFKERRGQKDRHFHWKSRNTKKDCYEYTINVTNGTTYATRDPGIRNGGR